MNRNLLPMVGHTFGKRSPVTCHFKCGNACAHGIPNESDNMSFREVATTAMSRRAALGMGAAAAVTVGVAATGTRAEATFAYWGSGRSELDFEMIAPVDASVDDFNVPEDFDWSPIIRWGDPLFEDAPEFDPEDQTAEAQARQFGYNNDYLDIIPDPSGRTGIMVTNHEYTNENIMFPAEQLENDLERTARVGMAAHGMSVVEMRREGPGKPWSYVVGGDRNRRITMDTPFSVDGPAAGADLLKTPADSTGERVLGTLNNCSGGVTPWGTILSGEENCDQYFRGAGTPEEARYGVQTEQTARRWEEVDERFDLRGEYANEFHRFNWIVEIDPQDPESTPVKHTSMGRFKHEGANVYVAADGTVVAYSGDDQVFDYVYKFVSHKKYKEGDRRHNMTLLSEGDLYVAKFTGDTEDEIDGSGRVPSDGEFDGKGEWLPLVVDNESAVEGMSVEEVLVFTRQAGDKVGATKMDRPEDVEPNPHTGKVYMALTKNSGRGAPGEAPADEANPRSNNRDGHVIELTEDDANSAGTTFTWSILILCGDPSSNSSTYFSGFPADKVSPISCPDNVAFDAEGHLWISTDGQPGSIGLNDGLFRVVLEGPDRGRCEQFLSVPQDAETCGPVIHDQEKMVYVAVQHPGENGTFEEPRSYFPDYVTATRQGDGRLAHPRPSVVQVFSTATGKPQFGRGRELARQRKEGRGPDAEGYSSRSTRALREKARRARRSYSDYRTDES